MKDSRNEMTYEERMAETEALAAKQLEMGKAFAEKAKTEILEALAEMGHSIVRSDDGSGWYEVEGSFVDFTFKTIGRDFGRGVEQVFVTIHPGVWNGRRPRQYKMRLKGDVYGGNAFCVLNVKGIVKAIDELVTARAKAKAESDARQEQEDALWERSDKVLAEMVDGAPGSVSILNGRSANGHDVAYGPALALVVEGDSGCLWVRVEADEYLRDDDGLPLYDVTLSGSLSKEQAARVLAALTTPA